MSLTILDVIVLVVVLISAVLAMVRGFVREVLSIASWVVAAVAAYLFYKPVIPLLAPYIQNTTVQALVAAAAIFFIALIIASYITMKISDFVIDSRVGAVDRALGFLFGAARGILLLVIALLFFNWLVPSSTPNWVANAQTRPMLEDLGERLMAALPEDVEASIVERFRGGDDDDASGASEVPPADIAADPAEAADPSYENEVRQNLDTLIENQAGN